MKEVTKIIRPVRKAVLYYSILFIILFFLIEAILSIVYHAKYSNNKLALTDLVMSLRSRYGRFVSLNKVKKNEEHEIRKLIRPDSSDEMHQKLRFEVTGVNAFEFDPWMQFRVKDYAGTYVNVKNYIRKSVPDFVQKSKDTLSIWFFGGSTMFGFNVADAETIPSFFARLYQQDTNYKKSLKVINYGSLSYFSYQEFKLLQDRVMFEKSPDLIFFLDGLNEIISLRTTLLREPVFSPHLREFFEQNYRVAGGKNISDSINAHYSLTNNLPLHSKSEIIFNNYIFFINAVQQLNKIYGFQSVFVWQPVPYYNYPNQQKDPFCDKNSYPIYNILNPKIRDFFNKSNDNLYLADLLKEEDKTPFVDKVHYSPALNKTIALLLLQKINTQILY